jgi:tetratricopeptide (TPR) repeat protein
VAAVVLVALTWAIYGQTLGFQFVNYDDNQYIYENALVLGGLSWAGVLRAFSTADINLWTPLATLSHMVDYQLFGLAAAGHHLTNVLCQCGVIVLLFLVIWRMTGDRMKSAFAAAIWGAYPQRAESVAWITERKDLLCGVFFVLMLLAYQRYTASRVGSRRRAISYLLVVLVLALSLLCKPMLVTAPLVLLLLDYWPLARLPAGGGPLALRTWRSLLIEKVPLVLVIISILAIVLYYPFVGRTKDVGLLATVPLGLRLENAVASYVAYLGQMVFPVGLIARYPFPTGGIPWWEVAGAAFVLGGISFWAWRERRDHPYVIMGWLWYLVMLLPVLQIIPLGAEARCDRYTYLPQIGLIIGLVWRVSAFWQARPWPVRGLAAAGASLVALLAVLAFMQTSSWRDSATLWQHTLAWSPNNAVAESNLAYTLEEKGDRQDALALYQKSLQLDPTQAVANNGLGNVLTDMGRLQEAEAHYRKAVEENPQYAIAWYNLGNTLGYEKRYDEAQAALNHAVEIDPHYAKAYHNMAMLDRQMGRIDDWLAAESKAIEVRPDFVPAIGNLAFYLATTSDPQRRDALRAERLAQQGEKLTGGTDPRLFDIEAAACAAQGKFSEAAATEQHALDLTRTQRNDSLANVFAQHLALFQHGQPLVVP